MGVQCLPPEPCDCGRDTYRQVRETISGYFYIGSVCKRCGVWTRDSFYYFTRIHALKKFKNNNWKPNKRYLEWLKERAKIRDQ